MKSSTLTTVLLLTIGMVIIQAPGALAVKKCYDCHEEAKERYTGSKHVHQPTKDEDCETCHKRHGFAQNLVLVDYTNELCYSCHGDLREAYEGKHVHFPVSDGKCWDCHNPHASDKKGLLRTAPEGVDDPNSCLMCHQKDLQSSLDGSVSHEPFAEQDCVLCHEPHASEHPGLLTAAPDELCGSCHEASSDDMKTAHAERNIVGLSCTDCHSGHSMNAEGLLSDRTHEPFASGDCEMCHSLPDAEGNVALEEGVSVSDLCVTCHDDVAEKTELAHAHPAVMDDNCEDCHEPHSSRHDKLLVKRESEICYDCHESKITGTGLTPHLPVVLGECASCHDVHGSDNAGLVKTEGSDLCLGCHEDFAAAHDSATTQHAAVEDCLLCHAPHEGQQANLLRADPSQLCRDCHEVDTEALSAASGHQPYMTANCVGCHRPHHSDTPHLVREDRIETCLGCHSDIRTRVEMPLPHYPATEDCSVCHAPHYSEDNIHLLTAREAELCETCHDYDDLGLNEAHVHTVAALGECSGCHNPHGAVQDKLLSGRAVKMIVDGREVTKIPKLSGATNELCFTCHDDLVEKFRQQGTHQPVVDGDCDACHAPHGSSELGFVKAPAPELCVGCHEINKVLEARHGGYALGEADCLQCHNPHVSDQPKLVRNSVHPPFAEESCDMCHDRGPDGTVELMAETTELCATCHESVEDGQGMDHVHAPFGLGDCSSCHGVHAADYPALLRAEGDVLCYSCHTDLKEDTELAAVHEPFGEGACLDCHKPHASQFTGLKTASNESFCFTCHEDMKEEIENGSPHAPVVGGECGACHEPHAGETHGLLTASKEDLCGTCHDLADPALTEAHSGFDVAESNCQNCHAAHVGPKGEDGLLLPDAHAPFAIRDCESCHENKQADQLAAPVKTMCLTCHDDFEPELNKPVVHAPVRTEDGCTGCHGPHVGFGSGLQKHDGVQTCLECHDDAEFTGEFQHEAAFDDCGTCHEVHSGDHGKLLHTPDIMELCLTCHGDAPETHYHPMGDETIDPRTQQPLNCIGCHSPHSSDYEAILIADRDRKLCVNCHSLTH